MLDSDEAAGFDEAMRQDPELRDAYWEMNLLSATVAAASVAPLTPRAGQLERLQARLGLQSSKSVNWLGISGWSAAAAALTFILLVDDQSTVPTESVKNSATPHATKREVLVIQKATVEELAAQAPPEENSEIAQTPGAEESTANTSAASQANDVKWITKVETKHLVKEIAVLREKLESAEKREQQRLAPVQGMAWPMVMTMRPPRATSQIVPEDATDASVVSVLGDALAGRSSLADNNRAAQASAATASAVPIYDPATGAGTLVANNLSDTNLWVTTRGEVQPRLLGKIPQSSEAYESVGFELPAGTIPDNFIITNDSEGKGAPPSDKNTVLIGPQ